MTSTEAKTRSALSTKTTAGWAEMVEGEAEKIKGAMEDHDKFDLFLEQSPEQLDTLFSVFYDDLRRVAHRIFNDGQRYTRQPTELVDDVWIKLRKSGTIVPEEPKDFVRFATHAMWQVFRSYMRTRYRRGKRLALDERDDSRRLQVMPDVLCKVEFTFGVSFEELDAALDRLKQETKPEREYETIIKFKYFGDLSVEEIAAYLNVPKSTVRGRLYQARRRLKTYLEDAMAQ